MKTTLKTRLTASRETKTVGLGGDRATSGFAYIIVPSDTDRESYIQYVYRTGFAMVITPYNDIIKDVKIPRDKIQYLEFPLEAGEYGSLIHWCNIPVTNQVVATGIHARPGEFYPYKEGLYVEDVGTDSCSISVTRNVKQFLRSVTISNDFDQDGGLHYTAKSSGENGALCRVRLLCNGNIDMYADNEIIVKADKKLHIQIAHKDDEKCTLTIDENGDFLYEDRHKNSIKLEKDKATIESKEINLGKDATEWTVKGQTLKTELEKVKSRVDLIIKAIQTALVASGTPDSGAAFKANMISILGAAVSEDFSGILSDKSKVE